MSRWVALSNPNPGTALCGNAVLGGLVWVAALPWLGHDLAAAILVLSPLVCVPLSLALLVDEPAGWTPLLRVWTVFLNRRPRCVWSPPSFCRRARWPPCWQCLGCCLHCSSPRLGVLRLARWWTAAPGRTVPMAGLIFLAVGGAWTVASRFGLRPLDFKDIIVLLTGVHFHYAGFVLPLLTGWAGRRLRTTALRVAAVGVVVGVPLVAPGITVGERLPWVLPMAAWTLAAACLLLCCCNSGCSWTVRR